MDEKGLGKQLQLARKKAGLTQQALCQKANLSYSTLAKIERGAIKTPSIFTIQSIAAALGVGLDELMGNPASQGAQQLKKTSKTGIKFVYFDVNGCLVHFFHRAFVSMAEKTGVSADSIETTFWQYNDAVCSGTMSMGDFNAALAAKAGVPSIDFEDYYLGAVEMIPGMEEVVSWAGEHYRIGLLTNTMPGFVAALRSRGLIPDIAYDAIIDSSELGCIKPDAEIFQRAAERAGVRPEEILFIDDTSQNVMAAQALGWQVLWCDDYRPEDTIGRIRQALDPN